MNNTNETLAAAAALLHARGEVCKALRAKSWDWTEIQALLTAEEQSAEALRQALSTDMQEVE